MSVLKSRRTQSKAEYLNVAFQICTQTMTFLTKLSARYSRLLASKTMDLATSLMSNVEHANTIFPVCEQDVMQRKGYLLAAHGDLMSLDVMLTICYEMIMKNPEGAFTTAHGKDVNAKEAIKKIEHMAETLGCLIDQESNLIKSVIKSDKARVQEKDKNN